MIGLIVFSIDVYDLPNIMEACMVRKCVLVLVYNEWCGWSNNFKIGSGYVGMLAPTCLGARPHVPRSKNPPTWPLGEIWRPLSMRWLPPQKHNKWISTGGYFDLWSSREVELFSQVGDTLGPVL